MGREKKKEIGVDVQSEEDRRECEERKEITLQGEIEDKRRERWSGRMAEQGSFRAAELLNSSAGVQRGCVCACVYAKWDL